MTSGNAILALTANSVDARQKMLGAKAPTPYLFNIPPTNNDTERQ